MKKRFSRYVVGVVGLVFFCSVVNAQSPDRFSVSVGAELGSDFFDTHVPFTGGVNVIALWQVSPIFHAGVGLGVYESMYKGSRTDDPNAVSADHTAWDLLPEAFVNAQINFSRNPSPFFLDVRAGVGMVCNKYLKNEKVYDSLHNQQWTAPMSLGLGKRFSLGEGRSIALVLRQDFKVMYSWNTMLGVSYKFNPI